MDLIPRLPELDDLKVDEVYRNNNRNREPRDLSDLGLENLPLRVVDIASGNDTYAHDFATQYPESSVIAIDKDQVALAQARRAPNLIYTCMDAYDLSPGVGMFDYIRINFSLHHFNDLDAIMGAMASVLDEEGTIVINDFDRVQASQDPMYQMWFVCRSHWGDEYKDMFVENRIEVENARIENYEAITYDSILASYSLDEVAAAANASGLLIHNLSQFDLDEIPGCMIELGRD